MHGRGLFVAHDRSSAYDGHDRFHVRVGCFRHMFVFIWIAVPCCWYRCRNSWKNPILFHFFPLFVRKFAKTACFVGFCHAIPTFLEHGSKTTACGDVFVMGGCFVVCNRIVRVWGCFGVKKKKSMGLVVHGFSIRWCRVSALCHSLAILPASSTGSPASVGM